MSSTFPSSTRNSYPKSINAADPSTGTHSGDFGYAYDEWPTLQSTHGNNRSLLSRCDCSCGGRFRLSWSAVSVFEILLNTTSAILTLFFSKNYLFMILPAKTHLTSAVLEWEFCEWIIRMYGGMLVMQVVLLISGIAIGGVKTRKAIYWGMLAGDLILVSIYSAFIHSMSKWNPANIVTVVLAVLLGILRITVLVLNPSWWIWAPVTAY